MSDELNHLTRSCDEKDLVIFSIVAVAILLAAGIAVFLYIYLPASRPGEATAEMMPSNSLAYLSVNFRPGTSQIGLARDFFALLEDSEFQNKFDDLLDEADDDTNIHFLEDVSPWLDTDLTFALLDMESDERGSPVPKWVGMVQVSDRELAADFLGDLINYLEDDWNTQFSDDT